MTVKAVNEFLKTSGCIKDVYPDGSLKIAFDNKDELPKMWDKVQTVERVFTVTSIDMHNLHVIVSPGELSPGYINKPR